MLWTNQVILDHTHRFFVVNLWLDLAHLRAGLKKEKEQQKIELYKLSLLKLNKALNTKKAGKQAEKDTTTKFNYYYFCIIIKVKIEKVNGTKKLIDWGTVQIGN